MMYMRSALWWDFTQRIMAVPYRRFGTTYRYHLHGSGNPRRREIEGEEFLASQEGFCPVELVS
jgi:hypothetical protein